MVPMMTVDELLDDPTHGQSQKCFSEREYGCGGEMEGDA